MAEDPRTRGLLAAAISPYNFPAPVKQQWVLEMVQTFTQQGIMPGWGSTEMAAPTPVQAAPKVHKTRPTKRERSRSSSSSRS